VAEIRTLIVDDQPDIRLLVRTVINLANEGLSVVGEAASGSEALAQVEECNPLVIILDEMMPEMSGLETARHIRSRRPAQLMVLCSAYLDEEVIARAREVGIDAWLSKDDVHKLPTLLHALAGAGGHL